MNITALTGAGKPTRTIQHPQQLSRVMIWEFRRFGASQLFWAQALGIFGLALLLTWALHAPDNFGAGNTMGGIQLSGFVAGTSAWGLLLNLPILLVVLVLLIPFLTVDGVTRDRQRRTHELLLTTALPGWAYVWGRYLANLVMSLALALLFVIAILGMGELLHLTAADYPAPEISTVLLLWIGMMISAVILVSSLGFALGTLFPHLSTLIKVMIIVAWIVGGIIIPMQFSNTTPPTWYINWDPTSGVTGNGLRRAYSLNLVPSITSEAQLQRLLLSTENKLPTLSGWFAPHLLLAGLSLGLVLIAALAFKRSRASLD